MGSMNTGAKGLAVPMVIIAMLCLMVLVWPTMAEPNSVPNQPDEEEVAYSGLALDYYEPPFDSENQDFTVLVYKPGGTESHLDEAIGDLGIIYDLRDSADPVTAEDLATHDLLIIGWNVNGDLSGLDPNILLDYITGRVFLSGHDLDFHVVDEGSEQEAAKQCLSQAILFVLDGVGSGLIVLGDRSQSPFWYLPPSWEVTVERKNGGIGSEIVTAFTPQGDASRIFDGLTTGDMCDWGTSYHDIFTEWGEDFAPLELGESQYDIVTIARAPELTVTLTNTDNRSSPCINRGETITYSIVWHYPEGQNRPDINDVTLVDVLAPGTEYVSSESSVEDQGQYNPTTGRITWDIGTLSPGAAGAAIVHVTVNASTASGEMLHNMATIRNYGILHVQAEAVTRVCCDGGEIIYVRGDAEGANNGSDWTNAFTTLQAALAHAETACQKNIWVAQGIYRPGTLWSDSFIIPDGVKVYGGFIGYESPTFDLNQRNLSVVQTILSGYVSEYVKNEKVVTMGNSSLLNGCVVEGAGENYGGIYGENADFIVEYCQVKDNLWHGIYCKDGSLTVNWCEVTDNGYNGIYVDAALAQRQSLAISNCFILRNASYEWAGFHGIYAKDLWTATIRNSVVNANGPEYARVAWTNYSGIKLENVTNVAQVLNCTIVGNKGLGIDQAGCTPPDVRNCILWDNNMATDGCQRGTGMGVFFSCVMNGVDANDCITTNPAFTYSDPNFAWHLLPDSPCIDTGDPCSNFAAGPVDIDGSRRVILPHIDMGAAEASCEDVWNPLDWDSDGDIDLIEFARFAAAWRSRDPDGPPADPNLYARWDATTDLVVDHVIDMKDLRVFCDGQGQSPGYFWMACWKPLPPPWPPMQTAPGIEPNEPEWDPNEPEWDPNDPNFPGMMMASGPDLSESLAMDIMAVYDPALEAQQLQDAIDFFYEVAIESPEEAAGLYEFLKVLEQDLSAIYESEQVYWDTQ